MWVIGELAMFYAGAVNVPLSIKLEESNDLLFRLVHGDVKYVMVSGTQLKKVRKIIDQLPEVQKVIVFDEQAEYGEKEIALSEVQKMGDEFLASHTQEEFLRWQTASRTMTMLLSLIPAVRLLTRRGWS